MNKSMIILVLALAIQAVLSAPRTYDESSLKESKRFKLAEFAYENLQKTVWPHEVYAKFTEYMNELKEWSATDESLKESSIYANLQEQIEKCLNLLNELNENPDNCEKQWALKDNHNKIRSLFDAVDNEKLRRDWVKKYMNFAHPMRAVIRNSYENFYTKLSSEVELYLSDSDASTEAEDIQEWNKKFSNESDYVKKQKLVMEFMALFPEERNILEDTCFLQYSNGL